MISRKRLIFVFKITGREFVHGQFFWLALAVQILTTLFLALISDVALEESERIYDTLSYFLTSLSGLMAGVFVGAYTWTRDFSKSGIGELICRFETKPFDLYISRFLSWAVFLVFYNLVAYATYGSFVYTFAHERFNLHITVTMTLLSTAHSILALSLAQVFGTFLRPALAFAGAFLLLAVGNISDTLTGVTRLNATDQTRLPLISQWAVDALQIWKPEILVMTQFKGHWQMPQLHTLAGSLAWAASMIMVFCCIAFFVTLKKQIVDR